jgi:fluoride exporter
MPRYGLVAAGGLVGCMARYWLAGAVQQAGDFDFPAGTLAVNILGSLVIGVVMSLSIDRGLVDAELRILLTTGFCGGFTTMSTFSYETIALLRSGEHWLAFGNFAATNSACFAAVWLGGAVARLL